MTTSLIDELQLDATNPSVSVSSLLRKTLIVAARLGLSDIPEWVNRELSGYSGEGSLPPYRIVHGAVKARTINGWIPVQFPTNDLQETVSEESIRESVAEIESLCARDGRLAFGFSAEGQKLLQDIFQHNSEFMCFLEKTRLDGILDEIRNRVLRWAIALSNAGVKGEGLTFTGTEKETAHSLVFHADNGSVTIGVVGSVTGQTNVAAGVQPQASSIGASQIRSLVSEIEPHIAGMRLDAAEEADLRTALAELEAKAIAKAPEIGNVRKALARIVGVIGGAGETVVTLGIKAVIEGWMKQHGIAP